MLSFSIRHRLWSTGFSLILIHFILSGISKAFTSSRNLAEKPILLFTFLEVFAGLLYLVTARYILNDSKADFPLSKPNTYESKSDVHYVRSKEGRNLVLWIVLAGIAMRLPLMFSAPILEDDYYRYLWDGAVVYHGFNPYAHSPQEVLRGSHSVPSELRDLAIESGQVAQRINHPYLRTIYPPVAQFTFALAHALKPWSVLALRLVLFLFDVFALVLLIVILRKLEISPLLLGLYWWNPLLVKEVYNSCHMDVIVVPFLLGTVLVAIYGQYVWALCILALAVGTKVWPVLLIPVVLRPTFSDPRRLIFALSFGALLVLGMFIPLYTADLDRTSGFIAYGRHWEMNDALFMGILWISEFALRLIKTDPAYSQILTRVVVMLILSAFVIRLNWKKAESMTEFCERNLLLTAALFLLSPTQFPWYYLWILPFLTIRPRYSLLLLTAVLPLYYLRFYFKARGDVRVFDNLVVWIEYMPVFLLILWEWYRGKGRYSLKWGS